jgi:aromatic-amino-acid transaminase
MLFDMLQPHALHALLPPIKLYGKDTCGGKIDLGVGVYRDEAGETPTRDRRQRARAMALGRSFAVSRMRLFNHFGAVKPWGTQ